jgi:glycosyltransferase involved in cell wall biosynthesis
VKPPPLVSVIVPVFNRAPVIGDAISSLARQTFQDLEIVVVDDGSSDGSAEVALRVGGKRVRVVRHDRNLGIPAARNSGIEAARGKFIAWLDSDDVSRLDRLARQVRFLTEHPDLALVGGCTGRIDWNGRPKGRPRLPLLSPEALAPALLFRTALAQSTIMGPAETFRDFRFRIDFPVCEDLDFFIRVSRGRRIANIPQILVDRRVHPGQISEVNRALVRNRKRLLFGDLLGELGIHPTDDDLERHITLGRAKHHSLPDDFASWAEDWLARLRDANQRTRVYDPDGLALVCARMWLGLCLGSLRGAESAGAAARLLLSPNTRGLFTAEGRSWLAQALRISLRGDRSPSTRAYAGTP